MNKVKTLALAAALAAGVSAPASNANAGNYGESGAVSVGTIVTAAALALIIGIAAEEDDAVSK